MPRLFIAINLPEAVKNEIEQVKQDIVSSFPDESGLRIGKWVEQKNLHLTLLFIGEVRDEKTAGAVEIVKQAVGECQSFTIKLKKICYGPRVRGIPRLIWAEIEENKNLERLVASLQRQLSMFRYPISKHQEACKYGLSRAMFSNRITKHLFAGHITLCRLRQWAWKQLEPEERPSVDYRLDLEFEVRSVEVMESKLRPQGSEYKILFSIKLQ